MLHCLSVLQHLVHHLHHLHRVQQAAQQGSKTSASAGHKLWQRDTQQSSAQPGWATRALHYHSPDLLHRPACRGLCCQPTRASTGSPQCRLQGGYIDRPACRPLSAGASSGSGSPHAAHLQQKALQPAQQRCSGSPTQPPPWACSDGRAPAQASAQGLAL